MIIVELDFSAIGRTLPADHGYLLYSALSATVPEIHSAEWLGIHTLPGSRDGKGTILLPPDPKVRVRLPVEKVPVVYPLAGKQLVVGQHTLRLGVPQIRMLEPSSDLWARLVVLKLANSEGQSAESKTFLEGVQRQVEALGIAGAVSLEVATGEAPPDPYARRVLRVKDKTITGYGVHIAGLSEEDSLKLQAEGLGGRRRMGCGLFMPIKERN